MYGNVGPSWNEKRIAQAIVGHICFVDVQGTPGHRCVCLVCAYYVAVCPLAAADRRKIQKIRSIRANTQTQTQTQTRYM